MNKELLNEPTEDAPIREISLEDAIVLAREFGTVRASVSASVSASLWTSLWDLVEDSVRDLVEDSGLDSVEDSVRDYIASIFLLIEKRQRVCHEAGVNPFFSIEKWEGVEHEEGINPFQSGIDLWESGYIPVYLDKKMQLYTKDGLTWEGE